MRDDRHADAGSFQLSSPAARASARISSLVRSASSSGLLHAVFARRLAAGTIVAAIVGVVAVDHNGNAALGGERAQLAVEFVLAVVTAVRRIGAVLGPFELTGANHFVREAGSRSRSRARADGAIPGSSGCRR